MGSTKVLQVCKTVRDGVEPTFISWRATQPPTSLWIQSSGEDLTVESDYLERKGNIMAGSFQVFVDAANAAAEFVANDRNALQRAILVAIEHPSDANISALEAAIASYVEEE